MDKSLIALTDALKKVLVGLQPNQNNLSFILLIGKAGQGKATLLRHNTHKNITIHAERTAEIYYNAQGIILELDETWSQQSTGVLAQALKQLNQCHRALKITGLLLVVDINELIIHSPTELTQNTQSHAQLLQRYGRALGYVVDTGFIFTKLDSLAGFCDFFQHDKRLDQHKPLGFSIDWGQKKGKLAHNYHARFEYLLESLSQDMLQKVHPVRSSLKRSLIREFPLQLANFQFAIESLLKQISPKHCRVCAIYFTSARQGGMSADHLNQKICHEYALTLPTQIPQSSNDRAYFIEGALDAFQRQTYYTAPRPAVAQKYVVRTASCLVGFAIALIVHHHVASSRVLDNVTQELLAYDSLNKQTNKQNNALFHLSKAADALMQIKLNRLSPPALQQLHARIDFTSKQHVNNGFLPQTLRSLEHVLRDPEQNTSARYHALKIYIMLGDPFKRNPDEMINWFQHYWQKNSTAEELPRQIELLNKTLITPKQALAINQQLVRDIRAYLNAIPAGYLYYSLLKESFSTETKKLHWDGFNLGATEVPLYFLKTGFQQTSLNIPYAASQFQLDNWVLERQDLDNLSHLLEQAYAYDYFTWWKQFIKHTSPHPIQNYTEGQRLLSLFDQADTLRDLTHFIQAQTSPDVEHQNTVFNQHVASHFTHLSLVSEAGLRDLALDIREIRQLLNTLTVVQDEGQTAFRLTKQRFLNTGSRHALSTLYANAKQLPEPVASWTEQIADDTWFLLLSDTKQYVNRAWSQQILPEYQRTIAHRYPLDANASEDIALADFNHFFAPHGVLNTFTEQYIKPFLDTSQPEWTRQEADGHVLPIQQDMIQAFVHANVITAMFFPDEHASSQINFSLQKIDLDPIIAGLELSLGSRRLRDTQNTDAATDFIWPESNAELILHSIEGKHYELSEKGPWALFKILQKFNITLDDNDGSKLQVLFEINGDSGHYLLQAKSALNPFTPGILAGFKLKDRVA
ncbi:MAG: type VI secretion protein IcmF [Legionella sp.]|nr:type VI secretion protein IcmF [Legionella sp.]